MAIYMLYKYLLTIEGDDSVWWKLKTVMNVDRYLLFLSLITPLTFAYWFAIRVMLSISPRMFGDLRSQVAFAEMCDVLTVIIP
jgi:hypothetical protein